MDFNCYKHKDVLGSMLIGNRILCGECLKKFFEKKRLIEEKIMMGMMDDGSD